MRRLEGHPVNLRGLSDVMGRVPQWMVRALFHGSGNGEGPGVLLPAFIHAARRICGSDAAMSTRAFGKFCRRVGRRLSLLQCGAAGGWDCVRGEAEAWEETWTRTF
jgi:hypothetical protein